MQSSEDENIKETKKPCNKCFHMVYQWDLKVAVEKQVEGQVALVNGDNLKQIIEKLLGIIKWYYRYKIQE
jgi:hypothetical protein